MKVKDGINALQLVGQIGNNVGVKKLQAEACMEYMVEIESNLENEITQIREMNEKQQDEITEEDKAEYESLMEAQVEYELKDLEIKNGWSVTASQLYELNKLIN